MSWKSESMRFIREQEVEHPEMSREQLRDHCSRHYPFAQRSGWAYKAFLSAMRERFGSRAQARAAEKHGQAQLKL